MAKKPMGDAQKTRAANARGLDRTALSGAKTKAGMKVHSSTMNNYGLTDVKKKAGFDKAYALMGEGNKLLRDTMASRSRTRRGTQEGKK